jgi:membrane-bound serine protease (ClpP class)
MMNSSIVLATVLTCALFLALLGLIAAASRHKKRATAGALHLIGSVARVETDLEPEGSVIVEGELWRARVGHEVGPVRRGSRARVVGASGHLLEVEPTD